MKTPVFFIECRMQSAECRMKGRCAPNCNEPTVQFMSVSSIHGDPPVTALPCHPPFLSKGIANSCRKAIHFVSTDEILLQIFSAGREYILSDNFPAILHSALCILHLKNARRRFFKCILRQRR